MPTRRQEKQERTKDEKDNLDEKIRLRAVGQSFKDDGPMYCGRPTLRSPSKREQKQLKKLNKRIQ